MSISQKLTIPRWKDWKILATQQFRLRNIIQIIGFNIGAEDLQGKSCGQHGQSANSTANLYYFTLHLTAMSAPFYTSEKIASSCPKWKRLDINHWTDSNVFGGVQALVLRIWCHRTLKDCDEALCVWGINLSGLVHLNESLSGVNMPLLPNTIVFLMPGGYYTSPVSLNNPNPVRLASAFATQADVRLSYSLKLLNKLGAVQQSIAQKTSETQAIKLKISSGDFVTPENRGNAMWRRFRNKSNHLEVIKLKEGVEEAKFRLNLLRTEKKVCSARLALCRTKLETLIDENERKQSRTMEEYRVLRRGVESLRESNNRHIQQRECHLHTRAHVNFLVNQLISELQTIYPIHKKDDKYYICGVHLPDSENLNTCDELRVSVGLGFVAHAVQMVSNFLQVPLRYPVVHFGSRSRILDLIADKFPDNEREFPLFCKGKDKMQFYYAVYLLNKNIAGLLWLCGLDTRDLRCTLSNLLALLRTNGVETSAEQIRSPASSILDLASSSFSIPSPLTSMNFQRPDHGRSRASDSAVDSISVSPATMAATVIRAQNLDSVINTNLSFSLDKGLNQIRDGKHGSGWAGGSESNLGSAPSVGSEQEFYQSAENVSVSHYLEQWSKLKPSSESSSSQTYGDSHSQRPHSSYMSEIVERRRQEASRRGAGDRVSVGLEVSDLHLEGFEDTEIEESVMEVEGVCAEEIGNDLVGSDDRDPLLDNVADRTEALANQTTSFNMFRTRFRSTLGGTN